eukprot:TRINITY_DN38262_c0_g1_i3.p1 TRINITY_DN38262_c0_g1~~TRINITY_DN38262_c0_g1_i3.p1  ORF type:complete len:100 (+),score=18.80 TRINITY_DN38262_c0_g1_i3:40-339(+)
MPIGRIECVVFDLDDTLWNTIQTLECAHKAMRAALATRCPEIDEQFGDAEAFRAEMLKTMDSHPDRKHDFTFLRKATLHRLLGNETHVTEIFELWFKVF